MWEPPIVMASAIAHTGSQTRTCSPEDFARDRVEPAVRELRLLLARRHRGVDRREPVGALDLDQLSLGRMIDGRHRDAVARADQAIAGVDQLRLNRLFAREETN